MQNERNKGKIIKVVKMDEKLNKQSIDRLDISNNCIELQLLGLNLKNSL